MILIRMSSDFVSQDRAMCDTRDVRKITHTCQFAYRIRNSMFIFGYDFAYIGALLVLTIQPYHHHHHGLGESLVPACIIVTSLVFLHVFYQTNDIYWSDAQCESALSSSDSCSIFLSIL
jgi:hypothetical protein